MWPGEIFHSWMEVIDADEKARVGNPINLLIEKMGQCRRPVFGFETKFKHLGKRGINRSVAEYVDELRALGFDQFVILKRKNLLRQAASVARGKLTQTWHYSQDGERPHQEPVELNPLDVSLAGSRGPIVEQFERCSRMYADFEMTLAAGGARPDQILKLEYEEDIERDPRIAFNRICSFAEVDPIEIEPDLVRIQTQPIDQLIANCDEVRAALRCTPYEWMANESTANDELR